MLINYYPRVEGYYYYIKRIVLSKKYFLISLSRYIFKYNCKVIKIEPSRDIFVNPPRFSNKLFFEVDDTSKIKIKSLEINICFIKNAEVIGGTNFIVKNNFAIHPDEFVAEIEVCPAETAKVIAVNHEFSAIRLPPLKNNKVVDGLAASLLGQCAGNYAHWLTEVLPKLAVLDSQKEFQYIPLLIDGWIHPNFYESIDILCNKKREIIKVERWEKVYVKNLLAISSTSYIPAESRKSLERKKLIDDGAMKFSFSNYAINLMKERILQKVPHPQTSIEKIFIRRESTSNGRNAVNADELERIALEFDFTIVEPGKMSFVEQVKLFRGVKIIAGQIGAALTNAIFSEKCTLIVLSPYYENANYNFFSELMGILGHDLSYVIGPQVKDNSHHLHRNYFIEPDDFRQALEKAAY